jgi:hypothetical protein
MIHILLKEGSGIKPVAVQAGRVEHLADVAFVPLVTGEGRPTRR